MKDWPHSNDCRVLSLVLKKNHLLIAAVELCASGRTKNIAWEKEKLCNPEKNHVLVGGGGKIKGTII